MLTTEALTPSCCCSGCQPTKHPSATTRHGALYCRCLSQAANGNSDERAAEGPLWYAESFWRWSSTGFVEACIDRSHSSNDLPSFCKAETKDG